MKEVFQGGRMKSILRKDTRFHPANGTSPPPQTPNYASDDRIATHCEMASHRLRYLPA